MKTLTTTVRTALPVAALLSLSGAAQEGAPAEMVELMLEAGRLPLQVEMLEDENEVENLQRMFGFYIDKHMWSEAAALFSENGTVEIGGSGIYVGRDRILEYFRLQGGEGPQPGILDDHMQLQPVVHVNSDGTARGRWHHFSQEAVHGESHHWGSGIYENVYQKEDGEWKIRTLHLYSTMRTPYDDGWALTALPRSEPSEVLPPDLPPSEDYANYPAVFVVPFHYENPVTGDNSPDLRTFQSLGTRGGLEARLAALDTRIGLLEDADAIERLHAIYGYYLARNQWDDLAGIFAEDGSIEIALRGVYRGRDSVRRNLDLYGVQGELPGQLHNHMQYQPVIHVAPDGQSALMRSRAFSMMGAYQGVGRWMGGVYENRFVKRGGVWQIAKDQVFNTYFAAYDEGWKDLEWRPAPGITESNPPDEPPTLQFEMYPRPFLPPYHWGSDQGNSLN